MKAPVSSASSSHALLTNIIRILIISELSEGVENQEEGLLFLMSFGSSSLLSGTPHSVSFLREEETEVGWGAPVCFEFPLQKFLLFPFESLLPPPNGPSSSKPGGRFDFRSAEAFFLFPPPAGRWRGGRRDRRSKRSAQNLPFLCQ